MHCITCSIFAPFLGFVGGPLYVFFEKKSSRLYSKKFSKNAQKWHFLTHFFQKVKKIVKNRHFLVIFCPFFAIFAKNVKKWSKNGHFWPFLTKKWHFLKIFCQKMTKIDKKFKKVKILLIFNKNLIISVEILMKLSKFFIEI